LCRAGRGCGGCWLLVVGCGGCCAVRLSAGVRCELRVVVRLLVVLSGLRGLWRVVLVPVVFGLVGPVSARPVPVPVIGGRWP
jgi:hypothetical protein